MSRAIGRPGPGGELSVIVATVLRGGTGVALALIAIGLGWLAVEGQPVQGAHPAAPLGQLTHVARLFSAEGVLNAGLLILVSVPVACVTIAAVWYLRRRYWTHAAVTLIALAILAAAVVVLPR